MFISFAALWLDYCVTSKNFKHMIVGYNKKKIFSNNLGRMMNMVLKEKKQKLNVYRVQNMLGMMIVILYQ